MAAAPAAMTASQPIGVFDSGIGGLTVVKALRELLPNEAILYLGDTARLPYGSKSPDTVTRYAVQCARALMAHRIKLLVVACNTASATALPALTATPTAERATSALPQRREARVDRTGRVSR